MQETLIDKIAKLINDEVDWAEWGCDDGEGYEIAENILKLIRKEIDSLLEVEKE